jgi:hypothetical protein
MKKLLTLTATAITLLIATPATAEIIRDPEANSKYCISIINEGVRVSYCPGENSSLIISDIVFTFCGKLGGQKSDLSCLIRPDNGETSITVLPED